jgi:hypothetical protein
MWPLMVVLFPGYNEMLRHGLDKPFWYTYWPTLAIGSGVSMSFGRSTTVTSKHLGCLC